MLAMWMPRLKSAGLITRDGHRRGLIIPLMVSLRACWQAHQVP